MTHTPKYLSPKHFRTFVAVIETFIQTNGQDAITAHKVAQNMDDLLASVDNPKLNQLSQLFLAMNIYSFLTKRRRFFKLNLQDRKELINDFQNPGRLIRWIDRLPITEGLSRDLIRGLKVLSSVGYYSAMESKKQVRFIPFEDRISTEGKDTRPLTYQLPMA